MSGDASFLHPPGIISQRARQNSKPLLKTLAGDAILAVWNDNDPDFEDDFNEWHFREHIGERTSVPELHRGRRLRAEMGALHYMAF